MRNHADEPIQNREAGAVSIFIVVFFALLIGVITVSFIGIVIRDANQSTNNDLSRSAYDSAQAGIEDAKRAIALYTNACNSGKPQCDAAHKGYFSGTNCAAFLGFATDLGLQRSGQEVKVQSDSNDSFQQAYTCVNVTLDTPDYVNSQSPYTSDVIPLKATGAVSSVTLGWFTHSDAGLADGTAFSPRTTGVNVLPNEAGWGGQGTPSLLRVELISYDASGTITDTDLQNNAKTLFLYPVTTGGVTNASFDQNITPPTAGSGAPILPVNCSGSGQFACNVTVSLGSNTGKTSFLRVTPLYKETNTTFRVGLVGSDTPLFAGVQPIVDSTGRANDLFRRVEARVRLQNQVLYPEYAVDVSNSLCKDYSVSDDPADFTRTNKCP